MNLATLLPLSGLCRLAGVSRAGFYRWRGDLSSGGVLPLRTE